MNTNFSARQQLLNEHPDKRLRLKILLALHTINAILTPLGVMLAVPIWGETNGSRMDQALNLVLIWPIILLAAVIHIALVISTWRLSNASVKFMWVAVVAGSFFGLFGYFGYLMSLVNFIFPKGYHGNTAYLLIPMWGFVGLAVIVGLLHQNLFKWLKQGTAQAT